ncbi:MAG: type II toxin-antitoxin system PemK/MazF family toxin [Opitutales bacterium]
MKRGDIVMVAASGDCGKPRPAVVIQDDALTEMGSRSIALCLMSSAPLAAPLFRIAIEPTKENGLTKASQIMVEKLFTVPREKIERTIGRLSDEQLIQLNRTLAFVIGLG